MVGNVFIDEKFVKIFGVGVVVVDLVLCWYKG